MWTSRSMRFFHIPTRYPILSLFVCNDASRSSAAIVRIFVTERRPAPTTRDPGFADPARRPYPHRSARTSSRTSHPLRGKACSSRFDTRRRIPTLTSCFVDRPRPVVAQRVPRHDKHARRNIARPKARLEALRLLSAQRERFHPLPDGILPQEEEDRTRNHSVSDPPTDSEAGERPRWHKEGKKEGKEEAWDPTREQEDLRKVRGIA